MPIVCGVRFRGTLKAYFFAPGDVPDLQMGDHVIVETTRGREMGQVVLAPQEVPETKIVGQLKPILERASPAALLDAQHYQQLEPQAVAQCKELVAKANLPMKIVSAEYGYDGSHLTFCFTSEQRVDFRDLVRDLAHTFKTRIELRQIGVRDEARLLGGVGKCGRRLCCATWLTDFCPVSIRMAKQQDLPLTPMEISGLCGRLLCCLEYENDYYQKIKSQFPKVGKTIETPRGPAKVIKVNALTELATLLLEDGSTLELTADQVAGKAPIVDEGEAEALRADQLQTLDASLDDARASGMRVPGASGVRPQPERPPRPATPPPARSQSSRPQRDQAPAPRGTPSKEPGPDKPGGPVAAPGPRPPRKKRTHRKGARSGPAPQEQRPTAAAAEGSGGRRSRRSRRGRSARQEGTPPKPEGHASE